MNSITNDSLKQNNVENSKSNSTIQLEFSEPFVQLLTTTYDSHSYSSIQQYYSRKRCASKESQRTINDKENINKKQRNNNDHLAFSENARNQQIFSLSNSNEIQQQNGRIIFPDPDTCSQNISKKIYE
jgi:hypothetical protein